MGRRFQITFEVTVDVELEEEVFTAVDDEFRKHFYDLENDSEIAEHIAYQMARYDQDISNIEGWILSDDKAKLISVDWDTSDCKELKT